MSTQRISQAATSESSVVARQPLAETERASISSAVPRIVSPPAADARAGRGVFARSTCAEQIGPELFHAEVSERWNVLRGPNGGYLAALLLATMQHRLGDEARRPRVF